MINSKKKGFTNVKGFTIVELVIVIAVVAILAAVLIPTFSNLIKKANLSADQQEVRNMNTALQVESIPDGFENPSDAIDALYNLGWNFGKLQTYSNGFHYAYNYSENKMYLLNENDEVIYPSETDKSKLWGIYDNASNELINGITNYIAFGNIISKDHFDNAFNNSNEYVIDLNDYCVKIEGTYSNVKLINGGVVEGTFSSESATTKYVAYEQTTSVNNTTHENVVFSNFEVIGNPTTWWADVTFKNCVFYNSSIRTYGDVKFENCKFINTSEFGSQNIDIYSDGSNTKSYTVNIKDCTFNGGYRGINVSGADPKEKINIVIDGCEFNALDKDKQMLQVAREKVTVEIKNTTFNALGNAMSLIEVERADTVFTFANNTISKDIPVEKYVTVDGSAPEGLDETITNLMK